MKWLTALVLGAILAFTAAADVRWPGRRLDEHLAPAGAPSARTPVAGLLFSIPIFLGAALVFRIFFNWHN